jgi:AcrR family transcriptional regulator
MTARAIADGRRAAILEAAVAVIAARGVGQARLADIAEEADVSLGLVQHYFRHRERLVTEAFLRETERVLERWREIGDSGDPPLHRLLTFLRLLTPSGEAAAGRAHDTGWAFWIEFWSTANRDPEIREQLREFYALFAEPFSIAIADGLERGEFRLRRPVQDVVDRMIALGDGLAVRTLLGDIDGDRMFVLMADALCDELGVSEADRRRAVRASAVTLAAAA